MSETTDDMLMRICSDELNKAMIIVWMPGVRPGDHRRLNGRAGPSGFILDCQEREGRLGQMVKFRAVSVQGYIRNERAEQRTKTVLAKMIHSDQKT